MNIGGFVSEEAAVESSEAENQAPDSNESSAEMFTVKIDGEEKQVTKEDLIRDYQIKEASYKRMKKAEEMSKGVKPYLSVIDSLKKGDLNVLRQLGLKREDILDFSEKELKAYIEESQLTAEQKEAKATKEENERLKQERNNIAIEQASMKVENDIMGAFKELNIPMKNNPRLIRRVAEHMFGELENNATPNATRSLKTILKTIDDEFSEYVERNLSQDADSFLDRLPKSFVDGIRKKGLKQVQSQMPRRQSEFANSKKTSPISDEFREYMKKELGKRG